MQLFVCGTFDANGGNTSSIGKTIGDCLNMVHTINGGTLQDLYDLDFKQYSHIVWMPNIDNSEDKILGEIKKQNPHAVLVSSKRVVEKEYTEWDVVGKLLASRSNLGIMITQDGDDDRYVFNLLDPLGNSYYKGSSAKDLGYAIAYRLEFLNELSRCPSKSIGDRRDGLIDEDFIEVVRNTADEFSKHVNANNPHRMLGNASTRCMSGFPAIKEEDGRIFVTRRNIDKKTISEDGFIETVLDTKNWPPTVQYWGDVKPSVDTPVQLMLFNHFPHVKYMIHGHVYIKNAPYTPSKIPCGYLEEFDEVVQTIDRVYLSSITANFSINLLGHGCMVLAGDLSYFNNIAYTNRPLPEFT